MKTSWTSIEKVQKPITIGQFNRQRNEISIVNDAGDVCRSDALPRNS